MTPMTGLAAIVYAAVLLGALALPTAGSVLDHHFMERLPGHNHLGPTSVHTHGDIHHHGHGKDIGQEVTALFPYEGGIGASAFILSDFTWVEEALRFHPTSVLTMPAMGGPFLRDRFPSPLPKPPRLNF